MVRRHDMSRNQLSTRPRRLRELAGGAENGGFVPVLVGQKRGCGDDQVSVRPERLSGLWGGRLGAGGGARRKRPFKGASCKTAEASGFSA